MQYYDPPSRDQIIAMDTIIRYRPDLKQERNKCSDKKKASEFIATYRISSYEARAEEKGNNSVKSFLVKRGIIV